MGSGNTFGTPCSQIRFLMALLLVIKSLINLLVLLDRTELETRLEESRRQELTQTNTIQAHVEQMTDLRQRLRQSEEDKQALALKLNAVEKELAGTRTQLNKVQLGGTRNY